jgi:hypothetical protein
VFAVVHAFSHYGVFFGFRFPLGFDSGRLITPFGKYRVSYLSKKTNNPNPSPTGKIWFGLYWFGAGGRTRTGTPSLAVDFESTTSANSITPAFEKNDERYWLQTVKECRRAAANP